MKKLIKVWAVVVVSYGSGDMGIESYGCPSKEDAVKFKKRLMLKKRKELEKANRVCVMYDGKGDQSTVSDGRVCFTYDINEMCVLAPVKKASI